METIEDMLARALADLEAGRVGEAERLCRTILEAEPHIAATEHLLGTIALQSGHVERARSRFTKAATLSPDVPGYHESLAGVEVRLGRYDEALASYRTALAVEPDNLPLQTELPQLARHRPRQVLAFFRQASEQKPDDATIQFLYGNALFYGNEPTAAVSIYQRVLALQPDHIGALDNLALALSDLGRLDEAIACLRHAIELNPHAPNTHNNLGLALLLKGDYAAAWPHHEYGRPSTQSRACPRWSGEPLNGARILLQSEQGFGDTLQFVRYAPLVAALGGEVILEVQAPLARLLTGMPGVARVISPGTDVPDLAFHCPLMSLPYVFGTEVGTIPASMPYLTAPTDRKSWTQRIPARLDCRVGLAWQGQKDHRRDRDRSMPASALAPLAAVADVSFYSLHKQPLESTIPGVLDIADLSDRLDDFGDTAAAIDRLDLVITVDTSIAHLAGALGKPVWLLLSHTPDWRWLLNRSDSPWYPTARLFRQPQPGDWGSVIREVTAALQQWAHP
ncbi:MAG: tetratricopeptide repeat protein [Rhizobiaceae bacterium]|nr:tetratricopeptide repeat protein [Rhizobiaceae bacterium]